MNNPASARNRPAVAEPADGRRHDLIARLAAALRDSGRPEADAVLEALPDKGLAHDHVRIAGTGLLARIPKQSQMQLAAADNLAYQAACFTRASAGSHAPRLHGVLPPSESLPRGALLVEEIVGRPARLPGDLPALMRALASIHALPLPPAGERRPLLAPEDALADLAAEIGIQAEYLAAAGLPLTVLRTIERIHADFRRTVAGRERPRPRLISFDAHPGNFVVRTNGTAVLVDLEKARYAPPPLDLGHATLYTSTTWDVESSAVLSSAEVASAYRHWAAAIGADSAFWLAWQVPLRKAMWLWSVTWCAKWRVLSHRSKTDGSDGEDWSTERSDDALVRHVRDRVDHYLSAAIVERIAAEFEALPALLRD